MYGIFTGMGVLGIISTSLLPETFKQEFPECIEDVEKIPSYPFFSFKVWEQGEKVDTKEEKQKTNELINYLQED